MLSDLLSSAKVMFHDSYHGSAIHYIIALLLTMPHKKNITRVYFFDTARKKKHIYGFSFLRTMVGSRFRMQRISNQVRCEELHVSDVMVGQGNCDSTSCGGTWRIRTVLMVQEDNKLYIWSITVNLRPLLTERQKPHYTHSGDELGAKLNINIDMPGYRIITRHLNLERSSLV
jgi:hypothetical protein